MNATLLLLALSSAHGLEPIARPGPPEPVEGECEEAIGIERGELVPADLQFDSRVARCSAVALPISEMQDLLATEAWANAVNDRYVVDVAHLEWQIEWYKDALVEANAPVPFWQQPYVPLVIGVIGGVGTCIAGAYAVSLIQ